MLSKLKQSLTVYGRKHFQQCGRENLRQNKKYKLDLLNIDFLVTVNK